jgi:hypothetical protein
MFNPVYSRWMAQRKDDSMPMDKSRYPENWSVISLRIRSERAKWRCEWCGVEQGQPNPVTLSTVILTVHHVGVDKPDGTPGDRTDKMDCRDENLAALCQRCHLNADRDLNTATTKQRELNRERAAREAAGQLPLGIED